MKPGSMCRSGLAIAILAVLVGCAGSATATVEIPATKDCVEAQRDLLLEMASTVADDAFESHSTRVLFERGCLSDPEPPDIDDVLDPESDACRAAASSVASFLDPLSSKHVELIARYREELLNLKRVSTELKARTLRLRAEGKSKVEAQRLVRMRIRVLREVYRLRGALSKAETALLSPYAERVLLAKKELVALRCIDPDERVSSAAKSDIERVVERNWPTIRAAERVALWRAYHSL